MGSGDGDTVNAANGELDRRMNFPLVLSAMRRRRKWFGIALLVALGVTIALAVFEKRKYDATVTLTAVSNTGTLAQASFLATAIGAAGALGGLRPSPIMVTRLATLPGVLREVAVSRPDPRVPTRVIDRLVSKPVADIPEYKYSDRLAKIVSVSLDRESGLVTLTVAHPDSALARFVANRLLSVVSRRFAEAVQANANATRQGEELRVDSAKRQLESAEAALVDFTRSNRVVAPYSEAKLQLDRLTREVSLAETVYQQALTERESAISAGLESRPAIAVVDSIAPELRPRSRYLALKGIGLAILCEAIALCFALIGVAREYGLAAVFPQAGGAYQLPVMTTPALAPDSVRIGRSVSGEAARAK